MTVVTNQPVIDSNQKRGVRLSVAGLLVMVIAFFAAWAPAYSDWSWFLLLIGVIVAGTGTYYINRWVRPPLPVPTIEKAFEHTNARYVLYNHAVLVPHLLLTPKGLLAIKVKRYEGPVRYDSATGKWQGKFSFRRFYGQGLTAETLGNPSEEVREMVEKVEAWLKLRLPDLAERVPVAGIALFLAPKVELLVEEPPIPVTRPETLKEDALALLRHHKPLPKPLYQALRDALEAELPANVVDRAA